MIPRKKNSKDDIDPYNYRPINLLSPLSKIMEKTWSIQIEANMKKNHLIQHNHQGGIKGRSTSNTLSRIYKKLVHFKAKNIETAIIAIDQSAAFDIVCHKILKKKLEHIQLDKKSVNIIMNYLQERKQIIEINSQQSEKLITGPISVSQGSILSGLLYIIMTLDMYAQTHKIKHQDHAEYINCKNTEVNVYVDDTYGIVITNKNENIWNKIVQFIMMMESYYISNKLVINVDKTTVTLISNKEENKKKTIKIQKNIIKHTDKIKILGTWLNDELNWNTHFSKGTQSLLANLKRRSSVIYNLSKKVGKNFIKTFANAILIGKMNYHIEAIGETSSRIREKIDNIMLKTAKICLGSIANGRTFKWIMDQMNWTNFKNMHEMSIIKMTHKFINSEDDHYYKKYLIETYQFLQLLSCLIALSNRFCYMDVKYGFRLKLLNCVVFAQIY